MAKVAKEKGWDIIGVLNNDMIGNIEGIDGVIDNRSFRIFSEPTPANQDEQKRIWYRFYGGEVDGPSRQLARYVHRMTTTYMPEMNPTLIYRLDRFGRGGHHRPFNDEGFAGIRIMETHENYNRQHQDIRVEDNIEYGDVIEGEVKQGMHVNIPFNPSFSMACEIESVEFIDVKIGVESYVALLLKAEEDPDVPGQLRLDSYSLATRLSFFLWNSPPDAELLDDA